MAFPYQVDPGKGQGVVYHCNDGFSYYSNLVRTAPDLLHSTIYLRCARFNTHDPCFGRAIIKRSPHEEQWINTTPHTCDPDMLASQARLFREEVLETCRNEHYIQPRQLFNNLSERQPAGVAERFYGHFLRNPMRNARLKQYPLAPHTLRQLGDLLDDDQYRHLTATIGAEDSVFAGAIGSPNRECLLFMSNRVAKYAVTLREAFADATFVPAPLVPLCAQVYQIVALHNSNVIPIAQILMPDKHYLTYQGMVHGFLEKLPNFRPRTLHMDFERAPIRAWAEALERVAIRCCYFHYVRAVLRKVKKLSLTDLIENDHQARTLVRSFLSIPLLPKADMRSAAIMLIRRATRLGYLVVLLPFFVYYLKTWMQGYRYENLSVFGENNRTNNASEAAQRNLRKETGPHRPNIWHFINAIRRYEWVAYLSTRRARRHEVIGRRQKVATLRNNRVITNCTADLIANNMSIKQFLKVTSTRVMHVFRTSLRLRGLA